MQTAWLRVELDGELAGISASALMTEFTRAYREVGAPADVRVFSATTTTGKVYYFSPEASRFASVILRDFNAVSCEELPEFDSTVLKEIHL